MWQRVTQLKLDAALLAPQAPRPASCARAVLGHHGGPGRTIYGKPADEADARRMPRARLAGRRHRVLTAVVIGTPRRRAQIPEHFGVSPLLPSVASRSSRTWPVASPWARQGPTPFKGRAAAFISHISGSYSGIMGLPMPRDGTIAAGRSGFKI